MSSNRIVQTTTCIIFTVLLTCIPVFGGESNPVDSGWELDSKYNKFYDASELDKFRATVMEILEVVPMKGMSPATALMIQESPEDEPILVHVCPTWFADEEQLGLKKGDRIKIRGSWAYIDEKDVFMAAKIKKGDYYSFKVRLTSDGTPFWTMSEEQLANERASD